MVAPLFSNADGSHVSDAKIRGEGGEGGYASRGTLTSLYGIYFKRGKVTRYMYIRTYIDIIKLM